MYVNNTVTSGYSKALSQLIFLRNKGYDAKPAGLQPIVDCTNCTGELQGGPGACTLDYPAPKDQ